MFALTDTDAKIRQQAIEDGIDAMDAFRDAANRGDSEKMTKALRVLQIAEDIYFGRKQD